MKMRPRNFEFTELVSVLEKEHEDVKAVMTELSGRSTVDGDSDIIDRLADLR